jgi:DNA (cytosine-5)-methyltransferase 1
MYQTIVSLADTAKGGRIYLNGKWLLKSGFEPASPYEIEVAENRIVLRKSEAGSRRVSAKSNQTIPVIDIQNSLLKDAFKSTLKLQVRAQEHVITITPAHTAQRIADRQQAAKSMTEGSLFSGGGLMTEAAASVGFTPRFAVELDPRYAETYALNHPTADMFNGSVEEVPLDALRSYAPLGLLTMGIPCEPYSQARSLDRGTQAKRDKSLPPEAHENGDMVFWALRAIDATNPFTVVIEESPNFLKAGAGHILMHAMRRMGYHVDARVVSPIDYGELQTRKRAIIIGRTDGPVQWPVPVPTGTRRIADILDPDSEVEGEWFSRATKGWLYDHWDRQTEKGNGFSAQVVTADSRSVGTIKKRYLAQQGDNPVLAHPTEEGKHRFFTLSEIKRLFGLPDSYILGDSKTSAGEICGQGVVVSTMAQIIAVNTGLSAGVSTMQADSAFEQAVMIETVEQSGQMDLFSQIAA